MTTCPYRKNTRFILLVWMAFILSACATIPVEERASLRHEINARADNTMAALVEKQPDLSGALDVSVGYFVGRVSAVKAPVVGAGIGTGVLVDKIQSTRTYMDINRLDLGLGLGSGAYRMLVLFYDHETLKDFRSGTWKPALSTESVLGEKQSAKVSGIDKGISIHVLAETGVALTVTPRFGRSINMRKWGDLSLFGGGNYLDASLSVAGTVSTPDDLVVIDYTIEQENEDKWNLLIGGNWDINKRWSFSAEYNGFIGSRDAFIMSLTTRF